MDTNCNNSNNNTPLSNKESNDDKNNYKNLNIVSTPTSLLTNKCNDTSPNNTKQTNNILTQFIESNFNENFKNSNQNIINNENKNTSTIDFISNNLNSIPQLDNKSTNKQENNIPEYMLNPQVFNTIENDPQKIFTFDYNKTIIPNQTNCIFKKCL